MKHLAIKASFVLAVSGAIAGVDTMAKAADPAPSFVFTSIDGGEYNTADWRGKPVLVVNTASMCGYTPQYAGLQALSDQLGDNAVVLAVPSDDFSQELASDAEVKEFCDLNYNLSLPMTTIFHVAKDDLHPFYAWVRDSNGFTPGWNFNKVLIGADGQFVKAWGSNAEPMGAAIQQEMESLIAAKG